MEVSNDDEIGIFNRKLEYSAIRVYVCHHCIHILYSNVIESNNTRFQNLWIARYVSSIKIVIGDEVPYSLKVGLPRDMMYRISRINSRASSEVQYPTLTLREPQLPHRHLANIHTLHIHTLLIHTHIYYSYTSFRAFASPFSTVLYPEPASFTTQHRPCHSLVAPSARLPAIP